MPRGRSQKEKQRKKKKKLLSMVKVISPYLGAFLAVAILVFCDFGTLVIDNHNSKSTINPPVRNIVHDENLNQITEFNLTIEKLGVNAPISPNIDGQDKNIYDDVLDNGLAHYKNTALPNSGSNIVIFGHSSTVLGIGKYSKIFAPLGKLKPGDEIKINFNQKEYKYVVTEKKIVTADDTSILLPTEREQLTLFTCWPVGTASKRLVVIAKPIN